MAPLEKIPALTSRNRTSNATFLSGCRSDRPVSAGYLRARAAYRPADMRIRAGIDAIEEKACQPIPYCLSTREVSGGDIAETTSIVFAGDKKHARTVRLVVRRVRPTSGSQLALFTAWDDHAFSTERDLPLAEVEADHRRHAVVKQTIAEL